MRRGRRVRELATASDCSAEKSAVAAPGSSGPHARQGEMISRLKPAVLGARDEAVGSSPNSAHTRAGSSPSPRWGGWRKRRERRAVRAKPSGQDRYRKPGIWPRASFSRRPARTHHRRPKSGLPDCNHSSTIRRRAADWAADPPHQGAGRSGVLNRRRDPAAPCRRGAVAPVVITRTSVYHPLSFRAGGNGFAASP